MFITNMLLKRGGIMWWCLLYSKYFIAKLTYDVFYPAFSWVYPISCTTSIKSGNIWVYISRKIYVCLHKNSIKQMKMIEKCPLIPTKKSGRHLPKTICLNCMAALEFRAVMFVHVYGCGSPIHFNVYLWSGALNNKSFFTTWKLLNVYSPQYVLYPCSFKCSWYNDLNIMTL